MKTLLLSCLFFLFLFVGGEDKEVSEIPDEFNPRLEKYQPWIRVYYT